MNEVRRVQLSPKSGQVVMTNQEWTGDPLADSDYFYTEIAKRFFEQFLQMKQERQDGTLSAREVEVQVRQYKKALRQVKEAAAEVAEDNKRLTEALDLAEQELQEVRAKYNALVMEMGRLQEKLAGLGLVQREAQRVGYSFVEHMDEQSRSVWESLMRDIPRPGGSDE